MGRPGGIRGALFLFYSMRVSAFVEEAVIAGESRWKSVAVVQPS